MKIAIAAELTPAKTLIPIIKEMNVLEKKGKLNWNESEIIALTHGTGAEELLKPFCDEIYNIGTGRRVSMEKKGKLKLGYLIAKDSLKAIKALIGKNVDLLITCGNAGDVRKSIFAANILRIPILHIEQDIYNPIELISFANTITVPSKNYENCLKEQYLLKSVHNIEGYPMAKYVKDYIDEGKIKTLDEVKNLYFHDSIDEYILLVLGGDIKKGEIPKIIETLENLDVTIAIAPYRFNKEYIKKLSSSNNIKVLDNYVDLLSLMKHSIATIYGAGMGITIEIGVLGIPAIKIAGFHSAHGSVDLAKTLNIPIVKIENLPKKLSNLNETKGNLIENNNKSIKNIIAIINNYKGLGKKSGIKSMICINKQRNKYK
ncbi:MAG: hypothetical protein LBT66_06160 [Methanobrevibacter sp.]|jgi:UDP-N-acetylglucosamine:LPS N-acetylglucosamine transferase|nr:hypothetical protein [Candidatus Methanovirga meridionalis]